MAKKVKRKIKKKTKTAQKQKQKQSQRTSVTVNIVNSKRKPRASAKPNTNRVLQQFAQPLITLPSNLINPPQIPDMGGLNISPLQRGTNQGLTGNILGEDSAVRERLRARLNARKAADQSPSSFNQSFNRASFSETAAEPFTSPRAAAQDRSPFRGDMGGTPLTTQLSPAYGVPLPASPAINWRRGEEGRLSRIEHNI